MTSPFAYAEHASAFDPSVVAALWSVTAQSIVRDAFAPYRVLPDGCLDLVLRVRPDEPDSLGEPDLFISGPARTASLVAVEPGTLYYGARFQPGRGGAAFGLAACSLTGCTLSGAEVRAVLGPAVEGLRGARDLVALHARLRTLLAPMTERARDHASPTHARAAVALLRGSHGRTSVGALARRLGVSERTLHRSVTEAVGLPPKSLASVLRFQHALALVRHGLPLAEAAARCGYSHQAHMTRAFQSLGGLTPCASAA